MSHFFRMCPLSSTYTLLKQRSFSSQSGSNSWNIWSFEPESIHNKQETSFASYFLHRDSSHTQLVRLFSPTHCQTCCRGQPLRFFSLTPFKTYGRDLAIETLLTQLTLVLLLSSLLARAWLSTLSTRYRVRSRFIGTCFLIDRVTHPGLSSLWSTAVVSSRTRQLTSLGSSTLWRRQLSTRRRRIWRLYGSKSCRELFLKSPSNEIDSF